MTRKRIPRLRTVVYPIGDGGDGQSTLEHIINILGQNHAGRVTAVTPAPDGRFGFVNKRKSILKIPVNRFFLDFEQIENTNRIVHTECKRTESYIRHNFI